MIIFITVGTHEQPFNRLVEYMDKFQLNHPEDTIIIQAGYSTYQCKYAKEYVFLSPDKMHKLMEDCDVLVTHGGPSSFIEGIKCKKRVIVVPRQLKFKEHINNHQVDFLKNIVPKYKGVLIPVFNIKMLSEKIAEVLSKPALTLKETENINNNDHFNQQMSAVISKIMENEN